MYALSCRRHGTWLLAADLADLTGLRLCFYFRAQASNRLCTREHVAVMVELILLLLSPAVSAGCALAVLPCNIDHINLQGPQCDISAHCRES